MIIALAALAATSPAAMSPVGAPYSLPALNRHHRSLSGSIVEVVGWLGPCHRLSCELYATPAALSASRMGDEDDRLQLGEAPPSVERQLAAANGQRVVVKVRVNAECWYSDHHPCFDRGDPVTPLGVRVAPPRLSPRE